MSCQVSAYELQTGKATRRVYGKTGRPVHVLDALCHVRLRLREHLQLVQHLSTRAHTQDACTVP